METNMNIETLTIHTDHRPQHDLLQELAQWKKNNPSVKILSVTFFNEEHSQRESSMITYIKAKQ